MDTAASEARLWQILAGYAKYLHQRGSFHATTEGHINGKAILLPLDKGENFCRYQWDDAGQRCHIEPLDQSGNGEISRQSHRIRYLWRAIEAVKSGLALLDRSPAKESEVPWYMHTCNDCKKPLYGHLWLYDAETNRFIMNCPAPELQPVIDFLASATIPSC